ncbi:hypothetical protein [Microbacterium sp. Leaf320]|uniref:hypothetical protein n=1 Tax=Microbacterium sp. Leaf320 TaxID=1736334 RepID=UPI0012FA0F65|nr:hypothetical protein [Microbacterium sp. Leaf320]
MTFEPDTRERPDSARLALGTPGIDLSSTSAGSEVETLPPMKPGSIGVRYRLSRRFRSCDAFACVPTYVAQTRGCDTVLGADGERIHGGRAYRPLLVDGTTVEATNENLGTLIHSLVPLEVIQADSPAAAERALLRAMRPSLDRYLLIDGEIWIRIESAPGE